MAIFFMWVLFSVFVGVAGKDRKIGGAAAFFCALLLSPLIGFFAVVLSKSLVQEQRERMAFDMQRQQVESLQALQQQAAPSQSVPEQLESLLTMKNAGALTEEEYTTAKAKVLSSNSEISAQTPNEPVVVAPVRWRPSREQNSPPETS